MPDGRPDGRVCTPCQKCRVLAGIPVHRKTAGPARVREALARAQFDTGQYAAAAENFRAITEASPTEDYAYFGLGLSLSRSGEHAAAAQYLALAAAMRPLKHYTEALRQVRATLEAQASRRW